MLSPWERFTIETQANVAALLDALQRETRPRSDGWLWHPAPWPRLRRIRLASQGFRVEMPIPWTHMNMMAVGEFVAHPEGTAVLVLLRPPWGELVVWFVAAIVMALVFGTGPGQGAITGLAVGAVFIAILAGCYAFGRKLAREEVERVLWEA
jgi:hypothetical protein